MIEKIINRTCLLPLFDFFPIFLGWNRCE